MWICIHYKFCWKHFVQFLVTHRFLLILQTTGPHQQWTLLALFLFDFEFLLKKTSLIFPIRLDPVKHWGLRNCRAMAYLCLWVWCMHFSRLKGKSDKKFKRYILDNWYIIPKQIYRSNPYNKKRDAWTKCYNLTNLFRIFASSNDICKANFWRNWQSSPMEGDHSFLSNFSFYLEICDWVKWAKTTLEKDYKALTYLWWRGHDVMT